jgi:hypothetical protein
MAKNPIIAVTDGGCRPDREWLEKLIQPLNTNPDYQAAAGRIIADPQSRFEYYAGLLCLPADSGDSLTRTFFGRSSAFRKSAWKRAGGYPEWLYTAEDTLFALRFNQLGMKVAFAQDSRLLWRPRPNLYRLGKMFFLYGVGNGRINRGTPSASLYWLRLHSVWILGVVGGFFFPWLFLVALADIAYLYRIAVLPAFSAVGRKTTGLWKYLYIPIIVFVRSFSTSAGFLIGHWNYLRNPVYRTRLGNYQYEGGNPRSDANVI